MYPPEGKGYSVIFIFFFVLVIVKIGVIKFRALNIGDFLFLFLDHEHFCYINILTISLFSIQRGIQQSQLIKSEYWEVICMIAQ